jgi:hypothetical protein
MTGAALLNAMAINDDAPTVRALTLWACVGMCSSKTADNEA